MILGVLHGVGVVEDLVHQYTEREDVEAVGEVDELL